MGTVNTIIVIILNVLIFLITFYLSFLFIKSKSFHSIPCYNMIIFSLIICFDNIFRILPFVNPQDPGIIEYIQAFILVWFDKLILATLSMQAVIYYLGVTKTNFYYKHETVIFTITFIISILITIALSGFYMTFGVVDYGKYCYCGDPGIKKKISDVTFNSIYVLINIFCLSRTLCYTRSKRKEATIGDQQDLDYKHHFIKTLIMFVLNNWAFLLSFLIIYDLLIYESIDIIYLLTCLTIALFNGANSTVFNETQKIFCNKKNEEKKDLQLKALSCCDEEEHDDYSRTESF